jgi:membrane-associated phospholipid phosphatase
MITRRSSPLLVPCLVGAVGLLIVLLVLAATVHAGPTTLDLSLAGAIQASGSGGLGALYRFLRLAGGAPVLGICVILVGAALWVSGRRASAGLLVGGWLGAEVLAELVKLVVHRPRPPSALLELGDTASFPSGHVVRTTVVLALLVATLVWPRRAWRVAGVAVAVLLALAMGLARIGVGDHWPTDVLGSYLLAGSWLLIVLPLWPVGLARLPVLRGAGMVGPREAPATPAKSAMER